MRNALRRLLGSEVQTASLKATEGSPERFPQPASLPADFPEESYLLNNPDVAAAVKSGAIASGHDHWLRFGFQEGRSLVFAGTASAPEPQLGAEAEAKPVPSAKPFLQLEDRAPSSQTAVDLFRDHWASDLGDLLGVTGSGTAKLFTQDRRPEQLARAFGKAGRIEGMSVLELGPLEAAHTWCLERLGASSIVAVESNGEAFLKCLIIKELLGLRNSKFLYGDVVKFLESDTGVYDAILCSGILYHMADPINLIKLICQRTSKCFVWTHYYDKNRPSNFFKPHQVNMFNISATYWMHSYGDKSKHFWGGNKPNAVWLEREILLAAFAEFGLSNVVLLEETPHPAGPAITFAVTR